MTFEFWFLALSRLLPGLPAVFFLLWISFLFLPAVTTSKFVKIQVSSKHVSCRRKCRFCNVEMRMIHKVQFGLVVPARGVLSLPRTSVIEVWYQEGGSWYHPLGMLTSLQTTFSSLSIEQLIHCPVFRIIDIGNSDMAFFTIALLALHLPLWFCRSNQSSRFHKIPELSSVLLLIRYKIFLMFQSTRIH